MSEVDPQSKDVLDLEANPHVFGTTCADGKHVDRIEARLAVDTDDEAYEDTEPDATIGEPVRIGAAVAVLTVFGLQEWGGDLPGPVEEAVSALIVAVVVRWVRARVKPVW